MSKRAKKVVLFIVEGPTDEDALSPILKRIFQNDEVRFHVVHGDVTIKDGIKPQNAINTINALVTSELERYGLRKADLLRVVHIIDTDGAFIPDDCVIPNGSDKIEYTEDKIIAVNHRQIIERNQTKTAVVKRLYSVGKISAFPYSVYFFSRNLEHALHNVSADLTDQEKIDYADAFADKYADDPDGFITLLSNSDFTVIGDYGDSWQFIFSGTNSLKRHCNLHILFQES